MRRGSFTLPLAVLLGACSGTPDNGGPAAVAPPPGSAMPVARSATAAAATPATGAAVPLPATTPARSRAWEPTRRANAGGATCRTSAPVVIGAVEGGTVTREPRVVVGPEVALVLYTLADETVVAVPLDAEGRAAGAAAPLPTGDTVATPPVALGPRAIVAMQHLTPRTSQSSIVVLDAAGRVVGAPADVTVPDRRSQVRQLRASNDSVLVLMEADFLPRVVRIAVGAAGPSAPEVIVDRPTGFQRMFRGGAPDDLGAWLALEEDEQGIVVLAQLSSDQQGQTTGLVFPPDRAVILRSAPVSAVPVALRSRAGSLTVAWAVLGSGVRGVSLGRDGSGGGAAAALPVPSADDPVIGRWQSGRAEVHLARQDELGRPLPDVTVARAHGAARSGDVPYGGVAWDGQAFLVAYEDCSTTGCQILTLRAFCPS